MTTMGFWAFSARVRAVAMAGPELGISLMSRLYCLIASSVRRITPAPASMPVILPSKSAL
ncbi:hypothetical protein D3C77_698950 [compost metagenome]